ncbi:MAG: polysaccharide export protein EpsE [Betaproteobacteria bacterium RIFCSPLOWO2_12_FULL_65_14]|nr:MAG: polysaccharide export protein EpsE [Betaproteobacteria bacterium RIFCSPLOWO2_12_FULL_65_14]
MKRTVLGLLLWAAAAAAYAQGASNAPGDKVGVGDAVRVTVFQQPDLTTDARVSERGTINMPLVGEVKVAGMSPNAAAANIAAQLKNGKFLKNPQVSLAVTTIRSRQVNVLGMVPRPGRYPLDESSSQLQDVIAAAGGIAPGGAEMVTLVRDGKSQKLDVMTKSFALKNGDTIQVERAPVFYIYGEVMRGGAYPLVPNMTVMQAIAAGGGMTPRGSERRLKLRRAAGDGKYVETDANLQDRLKADDVVYVKEAIF